MHHCSTYVRLKRAVDKSTQSASDLSAQVLGWALGTGTHVQRYGHIHPAVQRQALAAVASEEIRTAVNQIVHQDERKVEFKLPNWLILGLQARGSVG